MVDKAALKEAMYVAIVNKKPDDFKALIEHGVNINLKDTDNGTALHVAAELGRVDVMKYLLDKGIEVWKIKDGKKVYTTRLGGGSALHAASTPEAAKLLIDHGIDIDATDAYKGTKLYNSVGGANLNILTYDAEVKSYDIMAKFLIEAGADVNKAAIRNVTPLHVVRTAEIAKLLIAKGADVNAQDSDSCTPLHVVTDDRSPIEVESFEIAKILVDNGADLTIRNKYGSSPLCSSLKMEKIAEYLIKHGADINEKGTFMRSERFKDYPPGFKASLLLRAAQYLEPLPYVKFLIKHGARDKTIKLELIKDEEVRKLIEAANKA